MEWRQLVSALHCLGPQLGWHERLRARRGGKGDLAIALSPSISILTCIPLSLSLSSLPPHIISVWLPWVSFWYGSHRAIETSSVTTQRTRPKLPVSWFSNSGQPGSRGREPDLTRGSTSRNLWPFLINDR